MRNALDLIHCIQKGGLHEIDCDGCGGPFAGSTFHSWLAESIEHLEPRDAFQQQYAYLCRSTIDALRVHDRALIVPQAICCSFHVFFLRQE